MIFIFIVLLKKQIVLLHFFLFLLSHLSPPLFMWVLCHSIFFTIFFTLSLKRVLSHVQLLQFHEPQPTRLLCPWDSPGKNTGVGCHFLLQGNFLTQELNSGLPHCRQMLYWLSYTRIFAIMMLVMVIYCKYCPLVVACSIPQFFLFFFLIFFSFIFISWRLITSQHCSGFGHTLTWVSHEVTCIPHPDPPPTSLSTRFLWVFHFAPALIF